MTMRYNQVTGEDLIQITSKSPRYPYKPLHSMPTWKEYFEDLSRSIRSVLTQVYCPAPDEMESVYIRVFKKAFAESSSPLLTILAALESELLDLASRTKLTIHMVSADELDTRRASTMMQESCHFFPKLQWLVVGCVGPNIRRIEWNVGRIRESCDCFSCQRVNRSQSRFPADEHYHDFAKSDLFVKYPPDLIVAFHTGHGEPHALIDWQPTLHCILDLGVPAVFTTCSEKEAWDEEQSFNNMKAHFSKRPAENPWRGNVPKINLSMVSYDKSHCNY